MSIIIGLIYINKKVSPILLNYAEVEIKKLSGIVINNAVTKQLETGINIDKLFSVIQNKEGEIQTVDFNPTVVNSMLSTITTVVQTNLKAIEEGKLDSIGLGNDVVTELDKKKLKKGIIYEIPMGSVTGNAFLSNLGPKIPVKLNVIGSAISNIKTKISSYGINNALLEVFVHIEVTEQINIPFMAKKVVVSSNIPIALKLIEGKVPSYYNNSGLTKDSNIFSIPIE
jgi:sporulation protein YunB